MRRITSIITAACAATLLTISVVAAQGTLADRRTNVTFSGPVSIPGATLPAGTYVFRIADSPSNRHIVQIFNQDQSKLINTILAIPAERAEAEGDPVVSFKETPSNRPPAVRYWYYAGEKDGNEFVYPRAQAMMIASASGESVSAFDTDSTDMNDWKKGNVTKVTSSADTTSSASTTSTTASTTSTASTTTAAPEPAPAPMTPPPASTTTAPTTTAPTTTASTTTAPTTTPEPAPAPTPVTPEPTMAPPAPVTTAPSIATAAQPEQPVGTSGRSESLPRTASDLPSIGLIGLFALAGYVAVRTVRASMV